MKTTLLCCTALALAAGGATSEAPAAAEIAVAQAQSPGGSPMMGQRGQRRFQMMDANGDGAVTPEEVGANHEAMFEMMDADDDGAVTVEEFTGSHPGAGPGGGRMAAQRREAVNGGGILEHPAEQISLTEVSNALAGARLVAAVQAGR